MEEGEVGEVEPGFSVEEVGGFAPGFESMMRQSWLLRVAGAGFRLHVVVGGGDGDAFAVGSFGHFFFVGDDFVDDDAAEKVRAGLGNGGVFLAGWRGRRRF